MFWAQINNLRYTPDLQIMDLPETVSCRPLRLILVLLPGSRFSSQTSALRAHLSEQIAIYGDVHLVNLVNAVKYERPVKEAFENAMMVVDEPRAKYLYFDFHKECKGMRFDRVAGLVDRLRNDLEAEGCVCRASRKREEALILRRSFFHHVGPVPSPHATELFSPQPRKVQKSVVRTNCERPASLTPH